jgi:hypothetical protein
MKANLFSIVCACVFLTGCNVRDFGGNAGGAPSASKYEADYEASQKKLREQQEAYDKHTAKMEEQSRRAEALMARQEALSSLQESNVVRYGKILDKWEEQARRMDALFDKSESRAVK